MNGRVAQLPHADEAAGLPGADADADRLALDGLRVVSVFDEQPGQSLGLRLQDLAPPAAIQFLLLDHLIEQPLPVPLLSLALVPGLRQTDRVVLAADGQQHLEQPDERIEHDPDHERHAQRAQGDAQHELVHRMGADHAEAAGQAAQKGGQQVERRVVRRAGERMFDLDVLAAADAPEDGEQVQADQDRDDQDAVAGQREDDPPSDAGLPEGEDEDIADRQGEPDRPGDVRLFQFIAPPHS